MIKLVLVWCLVSSVVAAAPPEPKVTSVHIIRPPVRCPEGYKPDAKGRCRKVFERAVTCPGGGEPNEGVICEEDEVWGKEGAKVKGLICTEGEDCQTEAQRPKRGAGDEVEDSKMEKLRKRIRKMKLRRSKSEESAARSKHFILLLKKKKKELLKPKPTPHQPHPETERPPQEPQDGPQTFRPEEDPPEPPQTLFFGDEACVENDNRTGLCKPDPEVVETVQSNKEFKEWKPPTSSSESSSSSSDSESEPASGETEDEILERAIKIKLEKILRMKQRYGPALRRWLVERLREYEDSSSY